MTWQTTLLQLLELVGITGIAFTEPVISILDRGAPYLASFRLRRTDFVLSVMIVAFGPALGAFAIAQLARLASDGLSTVVHAIFLGLLTGLFVNSVAKHSSRLRIRYQFVLLVVTAIISALLYWQFVNLERLLVLLVPLTIIVVVRFLTSKRLDKILVQWAVEDEPVTVTQPHRVAMVVFDELPLMSMLDGAGRIDDAFPNFQKLANESLWLRNTTSMSASTRRAVPAILTGRFPRRGLFPTTRDHPRSLFSMLEGTYRLNVHESLTQVAAVSSSSTLTGWRALTGEAFRLGYRYSSPLHDEKDKFGGQTPDQYFGDRRLFRNPLTAGDHFLETLVPSDEPVLDFLHMLLPHRPWHYVGAGRHYGAPRVEDVVDDRCLSDEAVRAGRQRHLLQLQATDWFLGQVVERLHAIGAYDDAMLVVVADHGVSIRRGEPQRAVTANNYDELLWVPLFIKAPHQTEGVVDDRASMTLDILPTIAERLGIALSWDIEGAAASQPPPDGRERVGRVVLPAGGSIADIDAEGEQPLFARADGFA
ncbi:MAG TPA: sulfatase-like hydrolase/transferase, partial [Acidimicrobiia bacterium]